MLAIRRLALGAIAAGSLLSGAAQAESVPPFFGYSGYFGGPSPYYTPHSDVHQTTRMEHGTQAFGVRTYTPGGPFWRYQLNNEGFRAHRRHHRRSSIRVRG
ncbi:hypothetical protein [Enterovirga rhinocerotis]|uniref:Uncharacterized protein n=1 Tax=Enterovirga rhinocerotis TaxID=1339210 RepID=A0A4V3DYY5_9HYPH|nr:hypothetical protein [Enterovirga rhinocerotis]TDR93879.1 hypothetical protein EV668_1148 [Enterovirga rhinocerotis]